MSAECVFFSYLSQSEISLKTSQKASNNQPPYYWSKMHEEAFGDVSENRRDKFSKRDCCPDFLFKVMAEYLTDLSGLDEQ